MSFTSSYHDEIQALAKAIEAQRAKIYVVGSGDPANAQSAMTRRPSVVLTEAERLYLMGAEYKVIRARAFTSTRVKMLDDLCDAYNYIAMAFNEVKKNSEAEVAAESMMAAMKAEMDALKAQIVDLKKELAREQGRLY